MQFRSLWNMQESDWDSGSGNFLILSKAKPDCIRDKSSSLKYNILRLKKILFLLNCFETHVQWQLIYSNYCIFWYIFQIPWNTTVTKRKSTWHYPIQKNSSIYRLHPLILAVPPAVIGREAEQFTETKGNNHPHIHVPEGNLKRQCNSHVFGLWGEAGVPRETKGRTLNLYVANKRASARKQYMWHGLKTLKVTNVCICQ